MKECLSMNRRERRDTRIGKSVIRTVWSSDPIARCTSVTWTINGSDDSISGRIGRPPLRATVRRRTAVMVGRRRMRP